MDGKENELLITVVNDVKWIKKRLEGNGEPGLIKRICDLEIAIHHSEGKSSANRMSWDRILAAITMLIAIGAIIAQIVT